MKKSDYGVTRTDQFGGQFPFILYKKLDDNHGGQSSSNINDNEEEVDEIEHENLFGDDDDY